MRIECSNKKLSDDLIKESVTDFNYFELFQRCCKYLLGIMLSASSDVSLIRFTETILILSI